MRNRKYILIDNNTINTINKEIKQYLQDNYNTKTNNIEEETNLTFSIEDDKYKIEYTNHTIFFSENNQHILVLDCTYVGSVIEVMEILKLIIKTTLMK